MAGNAGAKIHAQSRHIVTASGGIGSTRNAAAITSSIVGNEDELHLRRHLAGIFGRSRLFSAGAIRRRMPWRCAASVLSFSPPIGEHPAAQA